MAATAAILLNVTLMAAVGTLIVTPDAPLLVASSFVLFFLAKVLETGRGVWWLAVGAAVGAALLSKYTALFFGPAILIWLIAVPKLRRWLISPWPYLGGLVALAMFSPVILWNADHQWVSFIKQIGRARIEDFRPAFIAELIPTQIAFATPLVFILGAMGLHAMIWRSAGALAARALINTMFWTIVAYFVWHSLHARVEANWFAPVYPAFAIAAAVAAHLTQWDAAQQRLADFCLRWAAPTGIVLFALLIVQANTGVAHGLSPRRHRAQRRRRLARARARDRGGARRARARLACSRRITAPRAGLPSICRKAPASRSRASASAGSTCPSPMQSCLPGNCSMSTMRSPVGRPSEGLLCPRRKASARSSASAGRWWSRPMGSICWRVRKATCSTVRRRRNCGRRHRSPDVSARALLTGNPSPEYASADADARHRVWDTKIFRCYVGPAVSNRLVTNAVAKTEVMPMDSSILKPASELARAKPRAFPNESAEYRRARAGTCSPRRSSCAAISSASPNCAARCRRAAR